MPLYEVGDDRLAQVAVGSFAALDMYEREDLQRLLRNDITPISNDLLVIAEESGRLRPGGHDHRAVAQRS